VVVIQSPKNKNNENDEAQQQQMVKVHDSRQDKVVMQNLLIFSHMRGAVYG